MWVHRASDSDLQPPTRRAEPQRREPACPQPHPAKSHPRSSASCHTSAFPREKGRGCASTLCQISHGMSAKTPLIHTLVPTAVSWHHHCPTQLKSSQDKTELFPSPSKPTESLQREQGFPGRNKGMGFREKLLILPEKEETSGEGRP